MSNFESTKLRNKIEFNKLEILILNILNNCKPNDLINYLPSGNKSDKTVLIQKDCRIYY